MRTWREDLRIPEDAKVFCRHGGSARFDVASLGPPLVAAVEKDPKISTPKFGDKNHPRIKFFPPESNFTKIREFINTCDGMIYGRKSGETFGPAIAEFSFCNYA
jgi:hypothetical protein